MDDHRRSDDEGAQDDGKDQGRAGLEKAAADGLQAFLFHTEAKPPRGYGVHEFIVVPGEAPKDLRIVPCRGSYSGGDSAGVVALLEERFGEGLELGGKIELRIQGGGHPFNGNQRFDQQKQVRRKPQAAVDQDFHQLRQQGGKGEVSRMGALEAVDELGDFTLDALSGFYVAASGEPHHRTSRLLLVPGNDAGEHVADDLQVALHQAGG